MKKIIVFIGVEGSGKDFATNQIIEENPSDSVRIGFSDAIRVEAFKKVEIDPIYGEAYEQWKLDFHKKVGMIGRELLIEIGEGYKKKDPYIWAQEWYFTAMGESAKYIVVNDCRFEFEAQMVRNLAKRFNAEIVFYYCCYKSDRFRPSTEPTDAFAMKFIKGARNLEDITESVLSILNEKSWLSG